MFVKKKNNKIKIRVEFALTENQISRKNWFILVHSFRELSSDP